MEKNYKKIEFGFGNIDSAMKELKAYHDKGELVYGVFNEVELYSDIDDIDSAYTKLTGKAKAEFDADREREHQEYLEEERKHKESIPTLTKELIDKGKEVLDEKYMDDWKKCVPIRLGDLYRGMELGATLEIVKELNGGCELSVAKKIIDEQGHSGMSFGLVRNMVYHFCNRGEEFADYVS